mmetsp:Transcript_27170/g.73354  ORF Transcript_27170/g.73354 Transcript_27170/m.73354 type:complete len:207 (+) Transcript_27170:663-1283(+)
MGPARAGGRRGGLRAGETGMWKRKPTTTTGPGAKGRRSLTTSTTGTAAARAGAVRPTTTMWARPRNAMRWKTRWTGWHGAGRRRSRSSRTPSAREAHETAVPVGCNSQARGSNCGSSTCSAHHARRAWTRRPRRRRRMRRGAAGLHGLNRLREGYGRAAVRPEAGVRGAGATEEVAPTARRSRRGATATAHASTRTWKTATVHCRG